MTEDSENRKAPRWKNRIVIAVVVFATGVSIVFLSLRGRSADSYEQECRQLADSEQWEQLIHAAQDWLDTHADSDEALIYLAEGQFQSGQPEKAIENLLRIPGRSPKSYAALITACNLQFGPVNRPLDGVETLKIMAVQKPSSVTVRRRLIFFYAVTFQRRAMLDAIYDAIAHRSEPSDAYAYLLIADHLSFTNGFSKNSEWLESDPESELFQVARMVHLIRNVSVAENPAVREKLPDYLKTFEEMRRRYPQNLTLLEAALERAIDDYDVERVEALVADIPPNTDDSVLLRQMAWLRFQQEKFEAAKELLEDSLAQHRLDWHTWHELAACRRRLGDADGAAKASEIAIQGKALRKSVMQLDDTTGLSREMLQEIAEYAENCGEWRVNTAILARLAAGQIK